jgi:azurin
MLNVFLLFAVLSTPQAASPSARSDARTVEISAGDNMKYSVPRLEATRGETLRIVLSVVSKFPKKTMAHNVVVLAKGASAAKVNAAAAKAREQDFIPPEYRSDIVAYTGLAGGGETVEVTFTVPDEAGNHEFLCTFPGHYRLGMKGTLVVK